MDISYLFCPFFACLVQRVHECVSCCFSVSILCNHFTAHSWHLMGSLSTAGCCSRNPASTNCPVLPLLLVVGHPGV